MKRVLLLCFTLSILSVFTAGQVTAGVTEEAPSYNVSVDNVDYSVVSFDAEMPGDITLSEAVTIHQRVADSATLSFYNVVLFADKSPPQCSMANIMYIS